MCKNRWQRSQGHLFKYADLTPENILAKHDDISEFEKNFTFPTGN